MLSCHRDESDLSTFLSQHVAILGVALPLDVVALLVTEIIDQVGNAYRPPFQIAERRPLLRATLFGDAAAELRDDSSAPIAEDDHWMLSDPGAPGANVTGRDRRSVPGTRGRCSSGRPGGLDAADHTRRVIAAQGARAGRGTHRSPAHGRSTRVENSSLPVIVLANLQGRATRPGQRREAAHQAAPTAATASVVAGAGTGRTCATPEWVVATAIRPAVSSSAAG